MRIRTAALFQFLNDAVRQLLTQLNAPLIKSIDLPQNTLDIGFVFVERNQTTQRRGR